jgi:hypothetical protein
MKICATVYQNKCWNDVISIKVDDFKLSKKLPAIPEGFKESSGECLAINAEQVFFGKQHPEGLDLKTALNMLREHPEVGYYEKNGAIIDLWRNFPDREFMALPKTGRDLLDNIYVSKPKYIEEA